MAWYIEVGIRTELVSWVNCFKVKKVTRQRLGIFEFGKFRMIRRTLREMKGF